jgi:FAD/FMN-containing dehydrogenase
MTTPTSGRIDLISRMEESITGEVVTPNDAAYDEARKVFYPFYDRHPALIVRPVDADDVSSTVLMATEAGLELAVRSGGHSLAGHGVSDGGITLDLSAMKQLEIDIEGRTALAQSGLTAGEYTATAGAHGLATGFGDTGSVGIGGLTLGGGIGFLVRKHGLTIDHLIAADLVIADGSKIRVDSENHPDLFWAIRGGGGNFGVATRFHFRLHEVDKFYGGMLLLPATPEGIMKMIEEAENAPEELSAIANIMKAPPMPGLPDEQVGKPMIMLLLAFTGAIRDGEKAVAPFRSLANPLVDLVGQMAYPDIYQFTEEVPEIKHELARSYFIEEINDTSAGAIVEHLHRSTAAMAVVQLRVLGGAMSRVPSDATAFTHRQRRLLAAVGVLYDDAGETAMHHDWVNRLIANLVLGEHGVYVGFMGDEGEDRMRDAYPGHTWDRLKEVKAKYDPTNLFRLNQNIPPDSADH